MRLLRLFLFTVVCSLFSLSTYGQDTGDFHICYFSLNNEKEFTEMQKFTERLNKHSRCSISVSEYMTEGDDPEKSFKKMIESGTRCDGLVISGHHTGSFGGKRSEGSLGIDFLEKLSCDEKYSKWFNNINALWLQGCRTLGTGEIVRDEQEVDADYHTTRVGDVLEIDHLEQSFAELNMEFSATLDQDNPLSSRYLRVFPGATVFGWTKTAPGERAGSQYSIPFHMAHISRMINNQDGFPKDSPIKGTWTKESAVEYSTAMLSVLNGEHQCQEVAIEAWKKHGKVRDQLTEYGFANPDLNAYTALMNTDDAILKQARVYDCLLKHSEDDKLLEVLDLILEDQTFIRYTYNALLERLQRLKKDSDEDWEDLEEGKEKADLYSRVVEKLKKSKGIREFLNKKLMAKQLGILRKIDYYAFYEEIYGENKQLRSLILDKADEAFEKIPSDTFDQRDYKLTLASSLLKHGYFDNDRGRDVLTRAFKNSGEYMKERIIGNVAGRWGERGLPILKLGIQDSSVRVRFRAIRKAGDMGETGLPIVKEAFRSSDFRTKQMAVETAGDMGETGLPIVKEAFRSSDFGMKLIATATAGRIGEAGLPIVKEASQSSDINIRREAVRAAGRIGEAGLPIVKEASQSSDINMQMVAVEAAGRIGEKGLPIVEKGLPILEKGIQSPDVSEQEMAFRVAGRIGEKGLPIVEKGIYHSNKNIRETALFSVGEMAEQATWRAGRIMRRRGVREVVGTTGVVRDVLDPMGRRESTEWREKVEVEIKLIKSALSTLKQGLQKSDIQIYDRDSRYDAGGSTGGSTVGNLYDEGGMVRDILDDVDSSLREFGWELDNEGEGGQVIRKVEELRDYIRTAF